EILILLDHPLVPPCKPVPRIVWLYGSSSRSTSSIEGNPPLFPERGRQVGLAQPGCHAVGIEPYQLARDLADRPVLVVSRLGDRRRNIITNSRRQCGTHCQAFGPWQWAHVIGSILSLPKPSVSDTSGRGLEPSRGRHVDFRKHVLRQAWGPGILWLEVLVLVAEELGPASAQGGQRRRGSLGRRQCGNRLFYGNRPFAARQVRQGPMFEPDLVTLNDDERAGGCLDPGAAIDVQNAVTLGYKRQMRMTAGHESEAAAGGILECAPHDHLAVALPPLGDPANPPRGAVGHGFLDEVEDPASNLGQPGIVGHDGVELVAVHDQELDLAIVEDVFVEDIDAHDVADRVGGAVVVAPNPHDPDVVAVGVAADDLQTGEMPLREPLEVEIIEDIAVDHKLAAVLDRPGQELLE